jgi:hypothetical protein
MGHVRKTVSKAIPRFCSVDGSNREEKAAVRNRV